MMVEAEALWHAMLHGFRVWLTLHARLLQGVENKRTYELNEEEINKLREEVGKYTTESDLVRPWQQQRRHIHTSTPC